MVRELRTAGDGDAHGVVGPDEIRTISEGATDSNKDIILARAAGKSGEDGDGLLGIVVEMEEDGGLNEEIAVDGDTLETIARHDGDGSVGGVEVTLD